VNENENGQEEEQHIGKGWDVATEEAEKNQRWLKLKGGEKLLINPMGQLETFKKQFPGSPEPSVRYRIEVFCPETASSKEWEFGVGLMNSLNRARKRQGDGFADAVFELMREGEGKEGTKWHLDYVRPLSDAEGVMRGKLITPQFGAHVGAAPAAEDIPF
jgi:hypothetical protein